MTRTKNSLMRRMVLFLGAICLAVGATVVSAPAAHADSSATFTVNWTEIGIYPRSSPSMDSAKVGAALSDGTTVTVVCEAPGQTLSSAVATNEVWDRLADGTYLPNVFLETGYQSWTPWLPRCDQLYQAAAPQAAVTYDYVQELLYIPVLAQEWALSHVHDAEKYAGSDCTWYVSQSLWAGHLPEDGEWSHNGNWTANAGIWTEPGRGPTSAAVNANEFFKYMQNHPNLAQVDEITWSDNSAHGAQLGDVIAYDWDEGADGAIDHLAIVTDFTPDGNPLVSQHTLAREARYWSWDESEGDWLEFTHAGVHGAPKAYLIHITF